MGHAILHLREETLVGSLAFFHYGTEEEEMVVVWGGELERYPEDSS